MFTQDQPLLFQFNFYFFEVGKLRKSEKKATSVLFVSQARSAFAFFLITGRENTVS